MKILIPPLAAAQTVEDGAGAGEIEGEVENLGLGATFDTFHPFPKLPVELRLKVWKHALPERRVVEIDYDRWAGWFPRRKAAHEPSALLAACKESREEFLRVYSLQISRKTIHRWTGSYAASYTSPVCYVDPEFDILFPIEARDKNTAIPSEGLDALVALPKIRMLRSIGIGLWSVSELSLEALWSVNFIFLTIARIGNTPPNIMFKTLRKPDGQSEHIKQTVQQHFPGIELRTLGLPK